MNKSKFFLFYIIYTSAFSCSAMEQLVITSEIHLAGNKQIVTQGNQQKLLDLLPIIGRLSRGETGYKIILDAVDNTVAMLETGRQGYLKGRQLYQDIQSSPTTEAITTYAQTGARILVNGAYSMGTHVTQYLSQPTDSSNPQTTFHEAHAAFKTNIPCFHSLIFDTSQQQQEYKKNLSENLIIIRKNIPSVGVRTAVIDSVIETINSDNHITEEYLKDCTNIIDEIVQISKTEDGQNILEASMVEQPTALELNDEEILLEQLLTPLTEDSLIKNHILSNFVQKYMKDDVNIQTVLANKHNQIAPTILRQLIPVIKEYASDMNLENASLILENQNLKKKTAEELLTTRNTIAKMTEELDAIQKTITTNKSNAGLEKGQLELRLTNANEIKDQLKEQLKNTTFWSNLKTGIGLTGLAGILAYLIMYKDLLNQLRDQLHAQLHGISYFNN